MTRTDIDGLIEAYLEANALYISLLQSDDFVAQEMAHSAMLREAQPLIDELEDQWVVWGDWVLGVVRGELFCRPVWREA